MKKKKIEIFAVVLMATFFSLPYVYANDEQVNETNLLQKDDDIVVVGTKTKHSTFNTPGIATVIDTTSLESSFADDLESIFKNESSVRVTGVRKNGQEITIRGYKNDSIVFLSDGIPQTFFSAHDGSLFVDPSLIKTVEVAHGSSSSLYGSGGLGGVVSFTTKDAKDLLKKGRKNGAEVGVGYSSVNNEYLANSSLYGVGDKYDYLVAVSYTDSGDIKLGNGSTLQSEDNISSALIKFKYFVNDSNALKFNYNLYNNSAYEPNNPREIQQEGVVTVVSDEPLDKDTLNQNISLMHEFVKENYTANTGFYYQNTSLEESIKSSDPDLVLTDISGNRAGDLLDRDYSSIGIFTNAQTSFNVSSLENILVYGLNFRKESQDGTHSRFGNINGVPSASANYYDGYLQTESSLNVGLGKFTLLAGVNYSKYDSDNNKHNGQDFSNSNDAWSPKIGLAYNNDWLTLFSNYSYGFRAPKMTELYASGVHYSYSAGPFTGLNSFIENPDLKPETNKTFEAGAGLRFNMFGKVSMKASYFNTDSENFIDRLISDDGPMPTTNPDTTQFINVASAKIQGVDASVNYSVSKFNLNVNYNYVEGENTSNPLNITPLESTGPNTLVITARYDFTNFVGLAWRSTIADSYERLVTSRGVDAIEVVENYDVHDIYLGFNIKENATINFGIENIFNEDYTVLTSFYGQEGRSYKASFKYKF